MHNITRLLTLLAMALTLTNANAQDKWTGTWAAAPQKAIGNDLPENTNMADSAIRQIVHVSIGGSKLRLQLSNEMSDEEVQIKSVYIANAGEGENIERRSAKYLMFSGKRSVTIEGGKAVFSDPLAFNLKPLQLLSITISYGNTPRKTFTSHLGSRTTSFIIAGEAKPKSDFSNAERVDHWYSIAAIDVEGDGTETIPVLGNSITDGRGSTTNKQDRWTDIFAMRLSELKTGVGVLNLGIGGNAVVRGGLAQPAINRFDRDILSQRGVKRIVIFEGVNDIGGSKGNSESVANDLITAYANFVKQAHERGIKVYGATITPFGKSQYASHFHEAARQTVNDWIRTPGNFDGVIDFDKLVADPANPQYLREEYQSDWLHLNAAGYRVMGVFAAEEVSKLMND